MALKIKSLVLVGCLFLFAGCEEFIEPSLEGKGIKLMAPGNNIESSEYQQMFWWQTQVDARHYHLQIVNPGFDNIKKLVLDTLVDGDKFVWTLEPGEYEWRVRPENGSSVGVFQKRRLTIFPSSIKDQQVQLSAPGIGYTTMNAQAKFSWVKLFGAANYRFQLDDKSFVDEKKILQDIVTENSSYVYDLPKEGLLQWRVRAEGAGGEVSSWSPIRTLVFDDTPPVKVVLRSPANKQSVSRPSKLTWDSIGDASLYEIALYNADSSLRSEFPQRVNTNSFIANQGVSGDKIIWRVRAIDQVGNTGLFSDYFSFTIQ